MKLWLCLFPRQFSSTIGREKIPLMPGVGAEFPGADGRIWLFPPLLLEKYKQKNLNVALEQVHFVSVEPEHLATRA